MECLKFRKIRVKLNVNFNYSTMKKISYKTKALDFTLEDSKTKSKQKVKCPYFYPSSPQK